MLSTLLSLIAARKVTGHQQNTIHQLQMVQIALVNAKIINQIIYFLLVVFSSAFNSTAQDKRLIRMHDLAFPIECMNVIIDMFTGIETKYVLLGGLIEAVALEN